MNFSDLGNRSEISYSSNNAFSEFDSRIDVDNKGTDIKVTDDYNNGGNNIFNPDNRISLDLKNKFDNNESRESKIEKQELEIEKAEKRGLDNLDGQERGNYGEMKTDQYLRNEGYDRISDEMVTDLKSELKPGIDGIYYKEDGVPQYIILDAKFNTAKLGDTLDGRQMSGNWIDRRLDDDIGKERADTIRMEKILNPENVVSLVSRVDLNGNVTLSKLDNDAHVTEGNYKL